MSTERGQLAIAVDQTDAFREGPYNEIRIHVARSRDIILVERGRRATLTLLYMEFHVGVGAGT